MKASNEKSQATGEPFGISNGKSWFGKLTTLSKVEGQISNKKANTRRAMGKKARMKGERIKQAVRFALEL